LTQAKLEPAPLLCYVRCCLVWATPLLDKTLWTPIALPKCQNLGEFCRGCSTSPSWTYRIVAGELEPDASFNGWRYSFAAHRGVLASIGCNQKSRPGHDPHFPRPNGL